MTPMLRLVVSFLLACSLFAGMRSDAADASASFDVASAYVYHGIVYNDGLVFQPSVDVLKGSLGFNTWANMDIWDYGNILQSGEFSEVDLTVYWMTRVLGADWCVSYAEYLFPHVASSTGGALDGAREIIVCADWSLPAGFVTGCKVQYEMDEYDDFYARLSIGYNRALCKDVEIKTSVTGAYAGGGITLTGQSGLHDYGIKLGLVYQASENVKVNGSVGYAGSLDEKVLPDQDVHAYGSLGLSYAM